MKIPTKLLVLQVRIWILWEDIKRIWESTDHESIRALKKLREELRSKRERLKAEQAPASQNTSDEPLGL